MINIEGRLPVQIAALNVGAMTREPRVESG
jgi:hypothetical protein